MGAATQADQYDEDHIFRYLVFYLDTSENAKKNSIASQDDDSLAANAADNDRRCGATAEHRNHSRLTSVIQTSTGWQGHHGVRRQAGDRLVRTLVDAYCRCE